MNLTNDQPIFPPGLAVVRDMEKITNEAVAAFQSSLVNLFNLQWGDESSRQDKLDRMGTNAATAIRQHADGVGMVLRFHARNVALELNTQTPGTVTPEMVADMEKDVFTWVMTNRETDWGKGVLALFPAESFVPPVRYTANSDGSVTIAP